MLYEINSHTGFQAVQYIFSPFTAMKSQLVTLTAVTSSCRVFSQPQAAVRTHGAATADTAQRVTFDLPH